MLVHLVNKFFFPLGLATSKIKPDYVFEPLVRVLPISYVAVFIQFYVLFGCFQHIDLFYIEIKRNKMLILEKIRIKMAFINKMFS